jgi:hypothetical protein
MLEILTVIVRRLVPRRSIVRFIVMRLREAGVVVDHRARGRPEPVEGELRIEHRQDSELGRPVQVARLLSTTRTMSPDLLPLLTDVAIVAMASSGFTLTGMERIGSVAYAQSWWVRPVDGSSTGRPGT